MLPHLALLPNPIMIPTTDREFLWDQVVDTLDDFFRIEQENRVKLVDGVLLEGSITTYPTVGSTLLEPWKSDSSAGYERLLATLQSIRRRADARVVPVRGGYEVHVAVFKEQEEVSRSERATVGSVVLRHDGSLVRRDRWRQVDPTGPLGNVETLGWTPMGRDIQLEQRIVAQIVARMRQSGCDIPAPPERYSSLNPTFMNNPG